MKRIWTTLGLSGLGFCFIAASASDANVIPFGIILLLLVFGLLLLVSAVIGPRLYRLHRQAILRQRRVKIRPVAYRARLNRCNVQKAHFPDVVG
jgi:hypothetical protein